jgi:hypothetical protein
MEKNKTKTMSEALSDIDLIKNALTENSKEILRHVAVEEIEGVVKKSINEDFEEEDIEDTDTEEMPVDAVGDLGDDSEEVGVDVDADSEGGEDIAIDAEPTSIDGMDDFSSDMDSEIDLTSASDSEVLAVYKQLSMSDEVEVVGDEVHLNITEPGKYIIKPDGGMPAMGAPAMGAPAMGAPAMELPMGEPEMGAEPEMELPMGEPEMGAEPEDDDDEMEFEEGVVYEVELTEGEGAHYEHMKATTPPNTGDIEGQTSKELPSNLTGDNLVGGFGEKEAKNGSGDAHGKHVMNATGKTDPTAKTNATAKPAEEKIEGNGGGSDGAHGNHVMETEELEDDAEDTLDEQIPVGMAQDFRQKGTGASNLGQPKGAGADKNESVKSKEYQSLVNEANKLKEQNADFAKKLNEYRKMLAETVVFNSNLTHVVKLFLENTTTTAEKRGIIQRFDTEVKSLKESKQLYSKVASELVAKRNTLGESMRGFDKVGGSGSSSLNEQTTYVDRETARITELMSRVENIGKNN